jgi:hypothetical protein
VVTARDAKGHFRTSFEAAERDYRAAVRRAQGASYQQIADELHYSDRGHAHHGVANGLAIIAREELDLDAARIKMAAENAELRAKLWHDFLHPPPLTDRLGRVVHDDQGRVVPDYDAKMKAAGALLRAQDRLARLVGTDPPGRQIILTGDLIEAEILRAEAALAERGITLPQRDAITADSTQAPQDAPAEL